MKQLNRIILLLLLIIPGMIFGQVNKVEIKRDDNGFRLLVDKEPFEIKGVVWSYTPIGENYNYDLWSQPDEFIRKMIDTDAELMKEMGVNTIRVFSTVPKKWIEYFYYQHGIYTVVNYTFARYGIEVNGKWHGRTDYSDLHTRNAIKEESFRIIKEFRNTPGVLMFMFGNENNYGLEWESDNIEDLPVGQQAEARAGYLYSLYEEVLEKARRLDTNHPSGIVNGDIQYLNIIEALVPSLKILGVNTYRGNKSSDLFYKSVQNLNVPVVYTEFGADAYNTKTNTEDQYHQAVYIKDQWQEIYEQSYGKGKFQNALGGYVFEWMDEWWKNGLTKKLDEHARHGSWTNGGYKFDNETGNPNMNEEWFGIVAQSQLKKDGIHRRVPRAAYYALQDIWKLSIYDSTKEEIEEHFNNIDLLRYVALGEANVTKNHQDLDIVSIKGVQLDLKFSESFSSIEMEEAEESETDYYTLPELTQRRSEELTVTLGFDPVENLTGEASIKVRGEVESPLFSRPDSYVMDYVTDNQGEVGDYAGQPVPVELYSASFEYDGDYFDLNGYYHTGLADWYLEGDYFNMMPESFDMGGMDLNGSKAPYGLMFTGNQKLEGLKIYAGPEIYYGARPQAIIKYDRDFNINGLSLGYAAVAQQDFNVSEDELSDEMLKNDELSQSASLSAEVTLPPYFDLRFGGYFGGFDNIGQTYSYTTDAPAGEGTNGSDYYLYNDAEIGIMDTLSGKIDLSTNIFRYTEIYGRYVYAGLVADTNAMIPRGGFIKDDSGLGNRQEINAGVKVVYSDLTVDVVGRKISPLVGPLMIDQSDDLWRDSPFYVGHNRETIEGEMVITYDPTGATWFHDWNAFDIENAPFAASLSLLYVLSTDVSDRVPYLNSIDTYYIHTDPMEAAENLWTVQLKTISNPLPLLKIGVNLFAGLEQGFGTDIVTDEDGTNRLTQSIGGSLRVMYDHVSLESTVVKDTWSIEESQAWERNFNITYPLQVKVDLSYSFDIPKFSTATSKVGIFADYKSYNEYSNTSEADGDYDIEIGFYSSICY